MKRSNNDVLNCLFFTEKPKFTYLRRLTISLLVMMSILIGLTFLCGDANADGPCGPDSLMLSSIQHDESDGTIVSGGRYTSGLSGQPDTSFYWVGVDFDSNGYADVYFGIDKQCDITYGCSLCLRLMDDASMSFVTASTGG